MNKNKPLDVEERKEKGGLMLEEMTEEGEEMVVGTRERKVAF